MPELVLKSYLEISYKLYNRLPWKTWRSLRDYPERNQCDFQELYLPHYPKFRRIIIIHFLNTNDKNTISRKIKVNPFFVKQYQEAKKKYSKKQLFYIFKLLKDYDLKSKGINNKSTNQSELLKELVFKILHA